MMYFFRFYRHLDSRTVPRPKRGNEDSLADADVFPTAHTSALPILAVADVCYKLGFEFNFPILVSFIALLICDIENLTLAQARKFFSKDAFRKQAVVNEELINAAGQGQDDLYGGSGAGGSGGGDPKNKNRPETFTTWEIPFPNFLRYCRTTNSIFFYLKTMWNLFRMCNSTLLTEYDADVEQGGPEMQTGPDKGAKRPKRDFYQRNANFDGSGCEFNMFALTWYEMSHFLDIFDSCYYRCRLDGFPKTKMFTFFEFYEFLRLHQLLKNTDLDLFERSWSEEKQALFYIRQTLMRHSAVDAVNDEPIFFEEERKAASLMKDPANFFGRLPQWRKSELRALLVIVGLDTSEVITPQPISGPTFGYVKKTHTV